MSDPHLQSARELFGEAHAAHGEPRIVSIHHGHKHADGSVTLHDEPYCVVKCGCGERKQIPFVEEEQS